VSAVFLDLDGTLTDSREGIIASVAHAMRCVGVALPQDDPLNWVIGPPLIDSFARLGAPDPQIALDHYRDRYTDQGLFENRVYDGVLAALEAMRDAGHHLYLATAKPHAYATRITAHFGLAAFMSDEFGPEMDGTRNNKADLLAHALAKTGIDPARAVMVGDRHHDFDAARAVNMPSIAVMWGYGSADELAQADHSCAAPGDLQEVVARVLGHSIL
jgi:phosphoglycolate phosphatase